LVRQSGAKLSDATKNWIEFVLLKNRAEERKRPLVPVSLRRLGVRLLLDSLFEQ
jgi:hypothetical protein